MTQLLQPGEEAGKDQDGLVDTTIDKTSQELNTTPESSETSMETYDADGARRAREGANRLASVGAARTVQGNYDDYTDYIDRPFSITESNIDDIRAEGQGTGEKLGRAGIKLAGKTATNVLGNTVGLLVGAGEVIGDMAENGFKPG
jgi:hypothetical protein